MVTITQIIGLFITACGAMVFVIGIGLFFGFLK